MSDCEPAGFLAPFPVTALSLLLVTALLNAGCRCADEADRQNVAVVDAGAPIGSGFARKATVPPIPKGMAWIPSGALVVGTPASAIPRKADQEMQGEQVILDGFFVDKFAYPNEEGAIPRTNVTHEEALLACQKEGKRLCSELEWERACKGPGNHTYEYGQRYQAATCRTGGPARPLPSGFQFSCRSDFGVHDMHGSIWEWTDSPWGRGGKADVVAVRGGNGVDGDVVGRCANGRGVPRSASDSAVGFRCCSGPRNPDEVTLVVKEGPPLRLINMPDRKLMRSMESKLPADIAASMKQRGLFRMVRLWEWQPLGNEDLLLLGGCAGAPPKRDCGVLVVRRTLGKLDVLDWVDSGRFIPTVRMKSNPRRVWVFGGDKRSHYKRQLMFEWGRVAVGVPVRNTDDD
jgi:formylglycine-generating enzyme required for sulfatase activity